MGQSPMLYAAGHECSYCLAEDMTNLPLWEFIFGMKIKSTSNLPCDILIPELQISAGD